MIMSSAEVDTDNHLMITRLSPDAINLMITQNDSPIKRIPGAKGQVYVQPKGLSVCPKG
jgi:hypothetical protein